MPETVTKFANLQTLEKLSTLIKSYVDVNDSKKMDSFTPGEGLSLEGGILKVTLDTTGVKLILTHLSTRPPNTNIPRIEAPFVIFCNKPPERSSVIFVPTL